MSMGGLVCKNVHKNYKKTEVLKGLDLVLEKGKIYCIIGANGSGKTTLLISAQLSLRVIAIARPKMISEPGLPMMQAPMRISS